MRAILPLVLAGLVVAAPAGAQQTEAQRRASLDVHADLLQCSSFFKIVATCLATRPDLPDAVRAVPIFQGRSREFLELGARLGLGLGLTRDAIESRYLSAVEGMTTLTAGQPCENMASLNRRWQPMCEVYAQDPAGAMSRRVR